MSAGRKLVCVAPSSPPQCQVIDFKVPLPSHGEVLVKVEATSVNPIDVKRASGYGQRLLKLKGAGRFPLTVGNDVAGVVMSTGGGVSGWKAGDRVFGLVPTGPQGAHASHVLVKARHLRASPACYSPSELATLPYTFTTLWLALRGVGLSEQHARHKQVLVHGASGGLGQLALQVLTLWGARVTAVCSTAHVQTCHELGATTGLDRTRASLSSLPPVFDASFNFANWADDSLLISRLKRGALGHATTVHPLLGSLDDLGWLGGTWHALQAWRGMRGQLRAQAGSGARYVWTIFQPDMQALDALHGWLHGNVGLHLPLGLQTDLEHAPEAFEHVAQRRAGRAVLIPVNDRRMDGAEVPR